MGNEALAVGGGQERAPPWLPLSLPWRGEAGRLWPWSRLGLVRGAPARERAGGSPSWACRHVRARAAVRMRPRAGCPRAPRSAPALLPPAWPRLQAALQKMDGRVSLPPSRRGRFLVLLPPPPPAARDGVRLRRPARTVAAPAPRLWEVRLAMPPLPPARARAASPLLPPPRDPGVTRCCCCCCCVAAPALLSPPGGALVLGQQLAVSLLRSAPFALGWAGRRPAPGPRRRSGPAAGRGGGLPPPGRAGGEGAGALGSLPGGGGGSNLWGAPGRGGGGGGSHGGGSPPSGGLSRRFSAGTYGCPVPGPL